MSLLWWALIAFIVAIIAGAFGFTGVAAGAATVARVLFGIFLALALIILILALIGVGIVV
jgi:uncharacterized membrane protein YtjA (UPF0391 family)